MNDTGKRKETGGPPKKKKKKEKNKNKNKRSTHHEKFGLSISDQELCVVRLSGRYILENVWRL